MNRNECAGRIPAGHRGLSSGFFNALKAGCLSPLLRRVQLDDTLFLAIRAECINIYYRGGSLMKVEPASSNTGLMFSVFFGVNHMPKPFPNQDESFATTCQRLRSDIDALPKKPIADRADAATWVDAIPILKLAIDLGLGAGSDKHEREFQQLVARENNRSGISNETEYFIADIEYASTNLKARFDILAVQWLAHQRKDGSNCKLALIEMKYGDDALAGTSGLVAHLEQAKKLLDDQSKCESLKTEMAIVFSQMRDLGLIRFGNGGNKNTVRFRPDEAPELVFLLANHNPRSPKLKEVLTEIKTKGYAKGMDVHFFVASFAGYGLHTANLVTLEALLDESMLFQARGGSQSSNLG